MHKRKMITGSAALAVFLFLVSAGCGNRGPDRLEASSGTMLIVESPPVSGWLEVVLPGAPVAMDGSGENLWMLAEPGVLMVWNTETGSWSSIEAENAFAVASLENGAAMLTPGGVTLLEADEATEHLFDPSDVPVAVCGTPDGAAVLFNDGSVALARNGELSVAAETTGRTAVGGIHFSSGVLAWMNDDGTVSLLTMADGLIRDVMLPEGASGVSIEGPDPLLLADCDQGVLSYTEDGSWEEFSPGSLVGEGIISMQSGVWGIGSSDPLASGLSLEPERVCVLTDGTVWAMAEGGLAVWGEIGSVETRLPEADIHRMTLRMAGQSPSGSGSGQDVSSPGVSMGGVFRIYESVSSRPDPFTEFPAARRDLRRTLEDLTIEELHLVGITLDAAGGNQAMVEDANGVAYVLREGTTLRNNTRIAEISGNEVIVVQEVTVGSEDDIGGTTSIPTIFSMRLHEEGGL